jgi:Tfp pilus assembly protein PilN
MIQFNLLPDIKIQYLKAQRQKHLVVLISTIATIAAITLLVFLVLLVQVAQKKNLSDLNKDIKSSSSELQNTKDINKILTVQNQLKSLSGLHDQKPVASRLFGYLSQVTPTKATISKLDVDFQKNTIVINGSADGLKTINTYVDTLKLTTYTAASSSASKSAFSNVVLSSFGRDNKGATYTISIGFDPAIFSGGSAVTLTVPQIANTHALDSSTALFQGQGTN